MIEILRPNADGDESNLDQEPFTGHHYDKVDEVIPDEDATYVYTSSVDYLRDLYNIEKPSEVEGIIGYIEVFGRCTSLIKVPTRTSVKFAIKLNGLVSESGEFELSSVVDEWVNFSYKFYEKPGGGNWSVSDLGSLQAGVSLRLCAGAGSSACTQLWVNVSYSTVMKGLAPASMAVMMG